MIDSNDIIRSILVWITDTHPKISINVEYWSYQICRIKLYYDLDECDFKKWNGYIGYITITNIKSSPLISLFKPEPESNIFLSHISVYSADITNPCSLTGFDLELTKTIKDNLVANNFDVFIH